jgi:CheY-specific phosphatase CheX
MHSSIQAAAGMNEGESATPDVVSKVLVYENDKTAVNLLKEFFDQNHLIGYRVNKDKVIRILNSSVDLGAVFIAEKDARGNSNIELALEIHKARPELPIFLRREGTNVLDDYPEELQKIFAGAYMRHDVARLKELVDMFLFTRHYPTEFVSAMKEMSLAVFNSIFKNAVVVMDPPYIVKDKIIYGELFSLMPLESPWCRGYMMLQTEESNILDVIKAKKTSLNPVEANFRHVNAVLGELSNMIWGRFKTEYGHNDNTVKHRVEVPIIINHARKYISFGSDDPQLCFKYSLFVTGTKVIPIEIYQKFVFSLDWAPEKYSEGQKKVDALVSNGELELF